MTVIIPHPDDELQIINFQKELIEKLFKATKSIFYQFFPLWIPISNLPTIQETETNPKNHLKNIGKIIKKVSFGKLQYENNQILIEVTISTEKEDKENIYKEKLQLIKEKEDNNSYIEEKIKKFISDYNDTGNIEEKTLKIFRVGLVHQISTNSTAISDSVWCKLK